MSRLLFILIFIWALAGHAEQEPFRVALIDQAPFGVRQGDKLKGVHVQLAELIGKKTGRSIQFSLVPPRRSIELLRQGEVDWLIMVDTSALEMLKTKRALLAHVQTSIYTLPSRAQIPAKGRLEMKLGRITDGCIELADQKGISWSEFKSYTQCLDNLLVGRIQGICATGAIDAEMLKRKLGPEQIKIHPISRKSLSVHALPRMPEKKWKEVEAAAAEIFRDNKFEQIISDYLKNP